MKGGGKQVITDKMAHDSLYVELEGESEDTKPTTSIGVNSKFYELDTGDVYYFDGSAWQKIGGSST